MSTLPECDETMYHLHIYKVKFTMFITRVDDDKFVLGLLHDGVRIVISLQAGLRNRDSIPGRDKRFISSLLRQDRLLGPPSPMYGYRGLSPWREKPSRRGA
jgi:hypothetical protein